MIKRVTSVICAALVCLSALAGCSADSSPAVLTLGDFKITANMYNYWVSTSKANIINAYSDVTDTADFWQSEQADGVSYAEYFDALIENDIKKILVCQKIYNDERLSLGEETEAELDSVIDSLITEYANGSKTELNAALASYGANTDILRNIYEAEAKRDLVYEYLYGENGTKKLTDDDKEAFFDKSYYHLQIIYINDKFEYVLDENGNYTTNSDGTYATKALSEEQTAEKTAAIDAVKAGIDAGEDFNALYETYSEHKPYAGGYYFSNDASYAAPVFYELAAVISEVEVGECTVHETDGGTYIMKRLDGEDGAWSDEANADFFTDFESTAALDAFNTYCAEFYSEITENTEKLAQYSIADVKANNTF